MKNLLSISILLVLLTTAGYARDNADVSGTWYHGDQRTFISAYGPNGVVIRTEDGRQIGFHWLGSNTLIANDQNLVGSVADRGRTIQWSNGTVWTRDRQVELAGTWFHNLAPTSIRTDGNGYVLRNEHGMETRLQLRGNMLVQPDGQLSGQLQNNGQVIRWNNNTVWSRMPGLR